MLDAVEVKVVSEYVDDSSHLPVAGGCIIYLQAANHSTTQGRENFVPMCLSSPEGKGVEGAHVQVLITVPHCYLYLPYVSWARTRLGVPYLVPYLPTG